MLSVEHKIHDTEEQGYWRDEVHLPVQNPDNVQTAQNPDEHLKLNLKENEKSL